MTTHIGRASLAAAAIATSAAVALTGVAQTATAAPAERRAPVVTGTLDGLKVGSYDSGFFDEGGAEIVAFSARTDRAFVVNSGDGTVDVLDLSNVGDPTLVGQLQTPGANSVAVRGRLVAVAQQAENKVEPGSVAFFDALTLRKRREIGAGALPDMVTFASKGRYAVVANEGEPEGYCAGQVDPAGSITVIDLKNGLRRATVARAGFKRFEDRADALRARGVRIFGPGASVAQDMEPEYIASRGNRAFVTLQENNAVAVVNLRSAQVVRILPLGLKDHAARGNGIDASDRDDAVNIRTWPVQGMYQPDAIAAFGVKRRGYVITANEGDAREYECLLDDSGEEQAEDERIKDLALDPAVFGDPEQRAALQADEAIGRLGVSVLTSPSGPDGYTELHALGARSVTIWTPRGEQVWDSGNLLERKTAGLDIFNANNDEEGTFDSRSDNKGPEPEGVAVGRIAGRTFAFVGLERTSAVAVIDVSRPARPRFQSLLVDRDDSVPADSDAAGDLGPEGIAFIPARQSPSGAPLLLVGNEVSGTTAVWSLGFTS